MRINESDLHDFVEDLVRADRVMERKFGDKTLYDMSDVIDVVRALRVEGVQASQKAAMDEVTKSVRDSRRGEDWRNSEDPPIGG
jgi:hypothetical protein